MAFSLLDMQKDASHLDFDQKPVYLFVMDAWVAQLSLLQGSYFE